MAWVLWATTWEPPVFLHDCVSCVCIPTDQSHFGNAASSGHLIHKDKRSGATAFGFTVILWFMAPVHSESLHIIQSLADLHPNMWHTQGQRGGGCITWTTLKMYISHAVFLHNSVLFSKEHTKIQLEQEFLYNTMKFYETDHKFLLLKSKTGLCGLVFGVAEIKCVKSIESSGRLYPFMGAGCGSMHTYFASSFKKHNRATLLFYSAVMCSCNHGKACLLIYISHLVCAIRAMRMPVNIATNERSFLWRRLKRLRPQ